MKKILKNNFKSVLIDTNLFIYLLTESSQFHIQVKNLFYLLLERDTRLLTSTITLTELLSFPTRTDYLEQLQTAFINIPNLELLSLTIDTAQQAARIKRTTGFSLPDSIQLATALISKAEAFLTNDQKLKEFKEIKVITLRDI